MLSSVCSPPYLSSPTYRHNDPDIPTIEANHVASTSRSAINGSSSHPVSAMQVEEEEYYEEEALEMVHEAGGFEGDLEMGDDD